LVFAFSRVHSGGGRTLRRQGRVDPAWGTRSRPGSLALRRSRRGRRALSTAATAFGAGPTGPAGEGWRRFGLGVTVLWPIAGPPSSSPRPPGTGAHERGLALVEVAWTSALSALLIREAGRRGPGSALSGRPG